MPNFLKNRYFKLLLALLASIALWVLLVTLFSYLKSAFQGHLFDPELGPVFRRMPLYMLDIGFLFGVFIVSISVILGTILSFRRKLPFEIRFLIGSTPVILYVVATSIPPFIESPDFKGLSHFLLFMAIYPITYLLLRHVKDPV